VCRAAIPFDDCEVCGCNALTADTRNGCGEGSCQHEFCTERMKSPFVSFDAEIAPDSPFRRATPSLHVPWSPLQDASFEDLVRRMLDPKPELRFSPSQVSLRAASRCVAQKR
jgi:hypothetical protein